jgi:hypothetical protein
MITGQVGKLRIHWRRERRATEITELEVDGINAAAHRIRILAATRGPAQRTDFLFQFRAFRLHEP